MPNIEKVWVRVCLLADLPDGRAVNLHINGQRLIAARSGSEAYIAQGYCSHMLYPLKDANVENGIITCSLHGSQFDLCDGHVVHWPLPMIDDIQQRKALKVFETRTQDGVLFVAWPAESADKVRVRF